MTLEEQIATELNESLPEMSWREMEIENATKDIVALLRQGPTVTVAGSQYNQNFMMTTLLMDAAHDARGTYALVPLEDSDV